jgi:hypothetical protein
LIPYARFPAYSLSLGPTDSLPISGSRIPSHTPQTQYPIAS